MSTVDDLAYLYLDLAAELKLGRAVLAGACFGGWIAAEMAVRNTSRFAPHLYRKSPMSEPRPAPPSSISGSTEKW